MSDDFPLGADCDVDAMQEVRIQRAIHAWSNPFKPPLHYPSSPRSGDRAVESQSGDGAPTSEER